MLQFISIARSVVFHLRTWYKAYQTIRAKYGEIRPIFADDITNSATKFDDKAVRILDKLFLVKKSG